MMTGKWRILAAFLCGLIQCGGYHQPEQKRQAEYGQQRPEKGSLVVTPAPRLAESPVGKFAMRPDYKSDACYVDGDQNEAELCAQWRAAIAGEKAAEEAWRASIISIFTAGLTALSLLAVAAALYYNRRANAMTAEALAGFKGAERGHLILEAVRATGLEDDGRKAKLFFDVANSGRSPAWILNVRVQSLVTDAIPKEPPAITTLPNIFLPIKPDGKEAFAETLGLSPDDFRRALEGALLIAYGVIRYEDIFGGIHETHFGYHINLQVFERVVQPMPIKGFWRYT